MSYNYNVVNPQNVGSSFIPMRILGNTTQTPFGSTIARKTTNNNNNSNNNNVQL